MKNRRQKVFIALMWIAAAGVIAALFLFGNNTKYISGIEEDKVQAAFSLLNNSLGNRPTRYSQFMANGEMQTGRGRYTAQPDSGLELEDYDGLAVSLDYNETAEYLIEIDTPGLYYLIMDYKPMQDTLADFHVEIMINDNQDFDEMKNIGLPLYWSDETKDYPVDRYGDQVAPRQVRREEWTEAYLYNNTYYTCDPLLFNFDAGINVIKITNISNDGLGLGTIIAEAPPLEVPTYEDYHMQYTGSLVTSMVTINSNSYAWKNTTQAIYGSENNPALMPHDSEYKLLNTLNWTESGSEVTYEMEVPEDGFYHIALHYKNSKEEFDVFNTIRIDGLVPFKELKNYAFASTGSHWENEVLSDEQGIPYEFYLTKGVHTITLRSEMEPIVEAYQYARLISEHVMQLELEITKITGANRDENRTWQMTRYIPEIPDYLEAYVTLINHIKYTLQNYTPNGVNSALLSYLDKALDFIVEMQEYPDEIALYKQNLTSGRDNSVLKSMSNFTTELVTQDFSLDRIYVYGNQELPRANARILSSLGNGFKTLIYSFTSEKFNQYNDPEALNIWVNRATTHVDLLQKMADTEFTPKTGIKVKISIMPDANKLTLAQAANETPDLALGLLSHLPFELASRGAIYDMTQFEDFWAVANRFVPGSLVPYTYNEGVYAIPETLDFYALIYRKDIYDSLGLKPPNTWQEVTEQLPTLQRYGMNFYHNISSGVGYKWYYQTSSLILQHNGRLFTEDGLRTAIDQPNGVKGIQALGDLFIAYSLPKEVISFFDSFRYGTLPIGIVNLNDYILIKNGAPELEGQWRLSDYPGTIQEDGTISRWYIANGTGGVIFKNSEKVNDAWEFLKWWTDYETQVNYTYTLQSTYGKTFVWLPSNVEAVKEAPFDQADKQVILDQIVWLRDITRTPGQYMLERSISDIWNTMINDGVTAQVAIDEQVIGINREINRKMKELGYFDTEGNLVKSYVIRDVDWIAQQMKNAKQEVE
ncbi:MAG: extracellular solute-binding protein [Clostridiales bacterium]|nr:extracellular solute-binding protein [Clostridiales bacterium]